jgi:hypothetical protein
MHLTEPQLQTYLDREMSTPEWERAAAHLQTCPDCQTTLRQIQTRATLAGAHLTVLDPTPAESIPSARAFTHLQQKLDKEPTMIQKLFSPKFRPALATGLIVILLALGLTVPSIRAAAVDFLGLFRVQQIEVVEFNPANLPQNMEGSMQNLDQLLADELKIEESGDPLTAASAAEASKLAGFDVILPQLAGDTRLTVQPATTASFTVDLVLWQSLLDEIGRSDIQIPAELDGQTITFHVDRSVTFAAGACLLEEKDYEEVPYAERDCTLLVQAPSPTIDAPPTLPINEVGQAALQLLGMSAEEAASFSAKVDWTTTLLVPVPTGSRYQEVSVQGVTGTIFFSRYDSGRTQFNLIWVKDGIVYSLSGPGGLPEALDLANSLK